MTRSENQPRTTASARAAPAPPALLPADLDLSLLARRPPKLPDATERWAAEVPAPEGFDVCAGGRPAASVVVVTYNNLAFTKLCVAGLFAAADPGVPFELIIVDNASTDGSVEYLRALRNRNGGVRLIFNGANRGFAPANNTGLAAAAGNVLVLLNNDTVVTPDWLPRLLLHTRDPSVGLAGPVTNRIGNEAEVEAAYRTYGEMLDAANRRALAYQGDAFDIPMPAMFCLAMRRDVYECVGPLDERFEIGMLEDDDYARRARKAGYRLVCAEDVFVHHFGQASFGRLVPTGEYMRLLEANQRRYHEKWGEPWRAYGRRVDSEYDWLVARVREAVAAHVPLGATAAVISRGDDALLDVTGVRAAHFPQAADGAYAGHYPADGPAAVAAVEEIAARGADFLVVPRGAAWWLEHYVGLRQHLDENGGAVFHHAAVCTIFRLRPARG